MPKGRLPQFRIYALGAAIVVPFMQFLVSAEFQEIGSARYLLGGYFTFIFVSSFFSDVIARRIDDCFYLGMGLLAAWIAGLMALNDFSLDSMAGMNLLTFTSVFIIDRRRIMAMFSVLIIVVVLTAALFVPEMQEKWLFLALSFVVMIVGNFAVNARNQSSRRLEHRLSNSKAIQKAAIDNNENGILLIDERGSFVKANEAYSKMWSIPLDWVDRNDIAAVNKVVLSKLKDPETLTRLWNDVETEQLLESDAVELEFLDGRYVETFWRTLRDGSHLIGRLWFFRDITALKLSQDSLISKHKKAEKLNQHLMDFATKLAAAADNEENAYQEVVKETCSLLDVDRVEIWYFDENETRVELQQGFMKAGGFSESGVKITLEDHTEYFDRLFASRLLVMSDTRSEDLSKVFLEGNYTGKASAFMHAQIRVEGKFVGVLAIEQENGLRDWTMEEQSFTSSLADLIAISISAQEKQKSQESLANSNALLQAIFDLSETGIIVEDEDHNILNFNGLYLKMWNMTAEFVANSPYKDIVAHLLGQIRNSESYAEGLEKLKLRPGMEYAGFIEFHDGRIMERYSKAIVVEGGRQGRVWFYLDITERKLRENELINRNFELDSFVYRASHDLKAPLNSIMGLIAIIQDEEDRDNIINYIKMMDKSVKKLDEFIRQLTQFSQDARISIVRSQIDLKAFVEELLEDLMFMENAKRLKVVMDIEQSEDFYSDPVRLGIIFNNLLSNAIKYQDLNKPEAQLLIQIRANSEEATCRFADNGQGIDEEHQEKVFDLFFRASIQASGSGLGLYITHNAIQKLGGQISIKSILGEGTNFMLSIPSIPATVAEPVLN